MSQLSVKECSFIVLGAWNPAIIQPSWLRKEFPDLIKSDTSTIEAVLGSASPLRFEIEEKIFLSCSNNNLVFIPKTMNNETMDFITKLSTGIQDKLSHTPLSAAGCNFVFKLDEKEYFAIDGSEKHYELHDFYDNLNLPSLTSRDIRHTLSFEDHSLNICYSYDGSDRVIQYNYDYGRGSISPMQAAALAFRKNYERSLQLNKELIKVK